MTGLRKTKLLNRALSALPSGNLIRVKIPGFFNALNLVTR